MHAGPMLILAAMLQGNQASSQAVDTAPAYRTDAPARTARIGVELDF